MHGRIQFLICHAVVHTIFARQTFPQGQRSLPEAWKGGKTSSYRSFPTIKRCSSRKGPENMHAAIIIPLCKFLFQLLTRFLPVLNLLFSAGST